jgi:hypothetical protein
MYFLILFAPLSVIFDFPDVTKADLNQDKFQSKTGIV